ncbi:hypothetical protein C3489_18795 [Streptomyces sp. Ru71]|uniref:hypothetical protein n=1 Tax=Streptomyces sp. Ru71 TaxID=2080746 RepID=UPI000CDD3F60|nr:hypothetical protein [Streptomyces sp. Ru71]POX52000.1 hypothetical protein C3489_18795 [Streptomyces sp. Ru71]
MSVRMFHVKIRPEKTAEMEAAGKEMFAAIEAAQPKGVRYTWCRLQDEGNYLFLVDFDDDAVNPLADLPAWTDVMADLKGSWIAEPLTMEQLTPIGSYRFF